MRILFTVLAVGACLACVYFLFHAAWTKVLIGSIVFVLSLMGLEVVRIRESMSRPIERALQEYLAQHHVRGIYAAVSEDSAASEARPNVFRMQA
jgi:hypothetical protein